MAGAKMAADPTSVPRITPIQQMAASCSGALATALLVTPFDVIKTRLQAQNQPVIHAQKCRILSTGLMEHLCICGADSNIKYNGTIDAFMKIRKYEGFSALWNGLPPTLIMALPATVIYFTSYDRLRQSLGPDKQSTPIIAGSIARAGAVAVISPLELIRTKLQAKQGSKYRGLFENVRESVRIGGIRSLWTGLGATLLRDVPFSAFYWAGYEYFTRVMGHIPNRNPPFHVSFIAGAASGTIAATVTLPFDVVKTHQQSQLGEAVFGEEMVNAKSTQAIMKEIVARQGWRGLFIGFFPRVAKVAPACAIMISSYEAGKTFFRNQNAEE